MRAALSTLLLAVSSVIAQQSPFGVPAPETKPWSPSEVIRSTNLTELVQWDGYSLFIKSQRVYLWSGEVHPWRLPVPELWPDVFAKIKALGFNAISMYTFWGLHNPSEGVFDFDGWKNLDRWFDQAAEAGLWVIARPGPYINAEVAGGGIPAWATVANSTLRTSDPAYKKSYLPYWKAMGELFERHQITNGGSIIAVQIENEYYLSEPDGDLDLDYIEELEVTMRSYGVKVPLTFNDVNQRYRLVKGKGATDIYGADSYPQEADCTDPTAWKPVLTTFRDYFVNTSGEIGVPFFIPEFQGGWIPGLDTKGYEQCLPHFGSEFERVFYLNNIAQGIKMHSIYMVYGGTNWGHSGYSRALTSYDYWAAISEDRSLKDKYYELKLISHFVLHSPDLAKTWVKNTSHTGPDDTIRVDELRNPDTGAGFYVVRHEDSTSTRHTDFRLTVDVGKDSFPLDVTLNGRDSRIIVTDYKWGNTHVTFSSAAVAATMAGEHYDIDMLFLYGEPDTSYTLGFGNRGDLQQLDGSSALKSWLNPQGTAYSTAEIALERDDHASFMFTGENGKTLIHVLDTSRANFLWTAVIASDQEFGAFYGVGSNETVIVTGPYFLRSAAGDADGSTLHLTGDLISTTTIHMAAPSRFTSFTWNGEPITVEQGANLLWSATLPGPAVDLLSKAPQIHSWKYHDSLPERYASFDDSKWVSANKTSTTNPNQPWGGYEGKYNLYLQDYGFAVGHTIIRGHFKGSGKETGLAVSLSPGTGGAVGVWLNGEYIDKATIGNTQGLEDVNVTISFPPKLLKKGKDNVIVFVFDNAPLEENSQYTTGSTDIQTPRGIRGYTLLTGSSHLSSRKGDTNEMQWKVQGNLGGWSDFPDKVRGIYNTGGTYGERHGWHLPGFDDKHWKGSDAIEVEDAGIGFWRGVVDIDYPEGLDLHYSFVFPNVTGNFRAQLFVNGWQFGRRWGDFGPQLVYPVPPGILVQGSNTVALTLFAFDNSTSALSLGGSLEVRRDQSITTSSLGLAAIKVESPTWQDVHR